MFRRKKLHECGVHNDIRFRGPLSYPVLQMLGWICIAMTVAATVMRFAMRFETPVQETLMDRYINVFLVGMLSLPFLLIANFARILNNSEGYRKQLLRTGLSMAGVAAAFIFIFYRYLIGSIELISNDPAEVLPTVMETIRKVRYKGFIPFNIFVDLFLCTLFMYFLNARPKKVFTGKKRYIFRAFGILPVAYEAASMILKANSAAGALKLPAWAYPFLTVKPPMTFVVFMVLAAYIKIREYRYCRNGRSYEEYQAFLGTNRNSRDFAVFTTVVLIAAGLLDSLVMRHMILSGGNYVIPFAIGVGDASMQVYAAPLVLLFSYTRVPKNRNIGVIIPAIGMVLVILVILQGAYQLLKVLNIPKIDMAQLRMAMEAAFTPVE